MNDTRPIPIQSPVERPPLDLPASLTLGLVEAAGATDRGKQRANNEDCFAIAPLPRRDGLLIVVADGLGGAAAGEVASRIAVDAVVDELTRHPLPADHTPRLALRRAVELANQALDEAAREHPGFAGFGTTLTAAVISWPDVWLAHVGDSRAYLWRSGDLEQLTHDHTMAERLREEGLVSSAQKVPSWESMLWNALGPSAEDPQLEERHERLLSGDRLLLCSDGLTRHVSDRELERRLGKQLSSSDLCEQLVAAANKAGGQDNITAVVATASARG
jgi:protein phosphatase